MQDAIITSHKALPPSETYTEYEHIDWSSDSEKILTAALLNA